MLEHNFSLFQVIRYDDWNLFSSPSSSPPVEVIPLWCFFADRYETVQILDYKLLYFLSSKRSLSHNHATIFCRAIVTLPRISLHADKHDGLELNGRSGVDAVLWSTWVSWYIWYLWFKVSIWPGVTVIVSASVWVERRVFDELNCSICGLTNHLHYLITRWLSIFQNCTAPHWDQSL